MKTKLILTILTALALSACSTAPSTKVSSLYTGYEVGSWYKFSPRTCSATLCPAY